MKNLCGHLAQALEETSDSCLHLTYCGLGSKNIVVIVVVVVTVAILIVGMLVVGMIIEDCTRVTLAVSAA